MVARDPFALARGTKSKGWIEVATLPGGSTLGIPWMTIKGTKDRPILTVNCSIHGDEYDGGQAIRELWSELDPSSVAGTLIAIPAVNVAALQAAQRVSPLDGVDLNRVFPGDLAPTITGMVARRYFHDVILHSDAVLDFHSGGNPLCIVPIVAFAKEDQGSRQLAVRTGVEFLWEMPASWAGNLCVTASQAGIPTVTPELGNNGRLEEKYVAMSRRVILNVMISMRMLEGELAAPTPQRIVKGNYTRCKMGGLFTPAVSLGEEVTEGQVVAAVQDIFGEIIEEVRAPCTGVVCSYRTIPPVLPGDEAIFIGEVV